MKSKKVKIKLIMPPRSFIQEARGMISIPPLGIAYLSAWLKAKNYQADIDDLDIKVICHKKLYDELLELQKNYSREDLSAYLRKEKKNSVLDKISSLLLKEMDYKGYDFFGFSLIESSAVDFALLLAKRLKKETGAGIVLGGASASYELKDGYGFIDHIILGSGEVKLENIIREYEGKPAIEENKISLLPKKMPDFDGLPFDCYRNMPRQNQYSNPGKILILPYIWSWGCPYQCSFCGSLQAKKENIFLKGSGQAIKEFSELSRKYKTRYFFVLNEYVHLDRNNTTEICRGMIERKLNLIWCGSARCNIDKDLLPLLAEAGCCYLFLGMESASDNILKKMRKGYTKKTVKEAVRETHRAGIWINLAIIVGFPGESPDDFQETFDFVYENHEYLDQLSVSPFYMVESPITREPKRFGIEILEQVATDKNAARERYAYNEINGPAWEELVKIKDLKLKKLLKLFYLLKHNTESNLRSSTYEVHYGYGKFKNKEKVREYVKKLYLAKKNAEEFTININSLCNNNCKYCRQPVKTIDSDKKIKEILIGEKKKGVKTIKISGGEPTLHPRLSEYIKQITEEGLEVTLNTNARVLSYGSFCRQLYNAGLRKISVPIYSYEPSGHDKITRVRGSYKQSIDGINNWKRIGGEVEVRAPLYPETKNNISRFVDFILELETGRNF